MSATATTYGLEASRVAKRFGGVRALQGCSIGVELGKVTGLIGPNGSGKTTLFNILSGYMAPDSGRVAVRGETLSRTSPQTMFRRGIVRTFQYARLFPDLTAVEVLALSIRKPFRALFSGRVEPADRDSAMAALERVGLADHANRRAGQLSYGQQRLLEFATATVSSPEIVLLDEPAAGVNPAMVDKLAIHIDRLRGEGVGVLVIEHQLDFIMDLCDTVVVLADGAAIASGRPREVARDPAVLDAYLGVE